jgi:hypothetical protein
MTHSNTHQCGSYDMLAQHVDDVVRLGSLCVGW